MAHQHVRIPPDSTGKKIFHRVEVLLEYDNGTIGFNEGDTIICVTSGLTGDILHVEGNTSTGTIHVLLDSESVEQVIDGENIQVDSVIYATTNGTIAEGSKYYIPQVQLQGANNTKHSSYIDQYGALYTRGKDGHFSFDAFGNTNSEPNIVLGQHIFRYGLDTVHNTIETSGSGTIEMDLTIPAAKFSCGLNSGDREIYTHDKYFHADPAHSMQLAMALYIGDSGKENVRRRWGYFDAEEGVWFELDGTTLYACVRNSQTGITTRVAQSSWNGDRVNGAGGQKNLSGYNVDITKSNSWIIEFQNATGYVFFKVVTDSGIVNCHIYPFPNYNSGTITGKHLMKLPPRFEQENTGASVSTSEMYLIGWIMLQSTCDYNVKRRGESVSLNNILITDKNNYTTLATLRMNKKFLSGDGVTVVDTENRSHAHPQDIQIYTSGGPIEVIACINPTLDGTETWPVTAGNLEIETSANYTSNGRVVQTSFVKDGEVWRYDHLTSEGGGISQNSVSLHRKANINTSPMMAGIAVKPLGATPVAVSIAVSWYITGS